MHASIDCRQLARWVLLIIAPAALHAQPIYRCGNTYSQTPCADAVVVSADDSRTAAQKAQTDAATAQATRQAAQMERERLAIERGPGAAAGPAGLSKAKKAARPTAASSRQTSPKTKASEPGYFTAAGRPADKKKAAATPATD